MAISNGTVLRIVASLLFPDSVVAQSVFHMVATDIVDGDNDTAVEDATEYIDNIFDTLKAYISEDMTGDEIKVYEYDTVDEDFDELGTDAVGITFTNINGPVVHGVALVQNFYTSDPDVQGRKFWAGCPVNSLSGQIWAGGLLTAAAAAVSDITSTFTATTSGNEYQPVVWSPTKANAFYYTGVADTNTTPGYQRRRKPGVGI